LVEETWENILAAITFDGYEYTNVDEFCGRGVEARGYCYVCMAREVKDVSGRRSCGSEKGGRVRGRSANPSPRLPMLLMRNNDGAIW